MLVGVGEAGLFRRLCHRLLDLAAGEPALTGENFGGDVESFQRIPTGNQHVGGENPHRELTAQHVGRQLFEAVDVKGIEGLQGVFPFVLPHDVHDFAGEADDRI